MLAIHGTLIRQQTIFVFAIGVTVVLDAGNVCKPGIQEFLPFVVGTSVVLGSLALLF